MPITPLQLQEMQARLSRNKVREAQPEPEGVPPGEEIEKLHDPTIKWCREHRAAYIHARTDRKSTIGVGVCDFVIAYKGEVFFIEYKTAGKKLRPEQMAFKLLLEMNGRELHVLRDFNSFISLINTIYHRES